MTDNITEKIIEQFTKSYSTDGHGDDIPQGMFGGLTLGVVVDTDDHLQQGRLRIFCPSFNDNPKKIDTIPFAAYITPFGGVINNAEFYRGVDTEVGTSDGPVHYGMWAIPERGAHVVVGCFDGDPRRRFWIGCLPEHQQTNTLHNGRFKWGEEGSVDGPLTGTGSPIQPLYDNLLTAFDEQTDRPEWLSRAVEYQVTANSETVGQQPNSVNSELDQENEQILENSPDEWTHPALGAHGYDWSGFKKLGAHMASRSFGISTPGMHAFTMDDRPFNQRVRLRTTNGHQLLMDDTNERIYIATAKGSTYLEMDQRGDIHVYGEQNINFHAEKNFNINADKIRLYARRGIHGYSGNQYVLQDSWQDEADPSAIKKQDPLETEPQDGEIRFHSSADFHIRSETNIRQLSLQDTFMEANGNWYGKVDLSSFYQVENEINIITENGDYSLSVKKANLNETVQGNSKRFSYGKTAVASNGSAEFMSFEGTLDVGAQGNVNVKSSSNDVTLQAMGNGSGQGNVQFRSPTSQLEVGNDGISGSTDSSVKMQAGTSNEFSVAQSSPNLSSPVSVAGLPEYNSNATPVDPSKNGPIPWDGSRSRITLDEAVQVAYNAGWRDKDLPIAVAVMMAESSLRTTVTNKAALQNDKWGDVVGLFQIRCLKNPSAYTGIDRLRDNSNHKLENPNENAKVAYQIWSQAAPPGKWTVGKWESFGGKHQGRLITNNLQAATQAVNKFLGTQSTGSTTNRAAPDTLMAPRMQMFYSVPGDDDAMIDISSTEVFGLSAMAAKLGSVGGNALSPQIGTAIKLSKQIAAMQGMNDVEFKTKSLFNNNNSYNALVTKLNATIAGVDQLNMFMATMIPKLIQGLASSNPFTLELPFDFNIPCLNLNIYDALMPPQLLAVAATLDDLNNQLQGIIQVPIDLYNIKEQLEGNIAALTKLGLPLDFDIPIDPSLGLCVEKVQNLNSVLKTLDIPTIEVPGFNGLPAQILANGSISGRVRVPLGG